ncbi:copper transport protein ATX1 [Sitophilus oryzae]|uniref:Copper transport protein ATOX1 n=1 Tax=Sitophilus oryzae TaxID=7048 RepID=A0A6J2X338_SITOR|nr:copper transport protein ATX1 [Sitophilus oryzae]
MSQVHEYRVAMTCEGCSGAVERVLGKHKDKIANVEINLKEQQVKVTTTLSANEVLELIKKTGKNTEYITSY